MNVNKTTFEAILRRRMMKIYTICRGTIRKEIESELFSSFLLFKQFSLHHLILFRNYLLKSVCSIVFFDTRIIGRKSKFKWNVVVVIVVVYSTYFNEKLNQYDKSEVHIHTYTKENTHIKEFKKRKKMGKELIIS